MSYTFPVLSISPSVNFKEEFEDISLRSKFEDGSELVRTKYTRQRRTFTINYEYLTTEDRTLLEDFYLDTLEFGVYTFSWTHPVYTTTIYGVRFIEPLKFDYLSDVDGGYWKTELKIREG